MMVNHFSKTSIFELISKGLSWPWAFWGRYIHLLVSQALPAPVSSPLHAHTPFKDGWMDASKLMVDLWVLTLTSLCLYPPFYPT